MERSQVTQRAAFRDEDTPRTVLVTGATSGLGRELALRLGSEGARVLVHGRDRERGAEVVRTIHERTPGAAEFHAADFASLDGVRELGRTLRDGLDRLDVLINNAGIYKDPPGRAVSEEGHELRFQVNHLSHFLLTRMLLPLLERSAPSRIVNVASGAQDAIDFDDPMLEDGFSASRAYGQSKLAQILFTFELADRLEGTGVTVNALHPATYMDTAMVRAAGVEPRSSVDEGARAVLKLVDQDVGSGRYFSGTRPARPHRQARDADARRRLWALSEELVGRD